ncbi:limonoid 1-O-acetyltransferse-like [Silene latifolia]|uniref:limonoid 1-O-acetyltransferse-like n=1 Tax=Silene latifolia TaxID=37657 RepID=UPI003D77762C
MVNLDLKKVGKGFLFSDVALTKLKAMVTSKQVPKPTRFESVLGRRIGAPLSEKSIGNLIANPIASGKTGASFPELVAKIHDAILKLKDETVNEFKSGGPEAVIAHRGKLDEYFSGYRKGTYFSSNYCRNGMSEADFGFGKPRLIVFPVMNREIVLVRNVITLSDYNNPDGTNGTVAWIFLEKKDMQILETNQEFLALTSKWE